MQVLWSSVAEEAYGSEKGLLAGLKIRSLKDDTVRHFRGVPCLLPPAMPSKFILCLCFRSAVVQGFRCWISLRYETAVLAMCRSQTCRCPACSLPLDTSQLQGSWTAN